MNELEKQNTVRADGQVSKQVSFEGNPEGSPRFMFVGNSITIDGSTVKKSGGSDEVADLSGTYNN